MFKRRVFDALEGARKDCPLGEQFCWHSVLPDSAPPPCRASDATRPWYVQVLDLADGLHGVVPDMNGSLITSIGRGLWVHRKLLAVYQRVPGHALHEKGLQRQIGVGTLGQQTGTKSAFRPGDKPLINRL